MIELIRSVRALCGVRRTSVVWHCQSRMDQTSLVHHTGVPPHLMAATPGTFSPFPLGRGSRNGLRTYYKEEYDLNAEDAEVHSGGSDVVSYSSTQQFTVLLSTSKPAQCRVDFPIYPNILAPQGVEGRWPWSSCVALFVAASHVQPVGLMAFDR